MSSDDGYPGWTGRDAADAADITYRQLDYWARTDVVRPSIAEARGPGSHRRYSDRDVLELKVARSLLDAGQKLERVRSALTALREHADSDMDSAFVVVSGTSAAVALTPMDLVDVVLGLDGALSVIPIHTLTETARG